MSGTRFEPWPVQLQFLARAEVAVAAVVFVCDLRELSQLLGREQTVGNGDAQHRWVTLDVEAVPQAQRANSSSESLPARKRFVWSRNWTTRSSTSFWSISS